jgi:hypothetical protein
LVPALLAGGIVFTPIWVALFDKLDCVLLDVALFLRSMRAKIFCWNFVLTEAANDLI